MNFVAVIQVVQNIKLIRFLFMIHFLHAHSANPKISLLRNMILFNYNTLVRYIITLGTKGIKVLKNVDYYVFRQALIKAIMEHIRKSGVSGQDIQNIIKQILDDKRFE